MGKSIQDDLTTLTLPAKRTAAEDRLVALTVVWHADPTRVGDRVRLSGLASGVVIGRSTPEFSAADGRTGGPLGDRYVSRGAFTLRAGPAGSIVIEVADGKALAVDGSDVSGTVSVGRERLAHGVVLLVQRRVLLLVHTLGPPTLGSTDHGLLGISEVMRELRADIDRAAPLRAAALLRGASGTGKELVARAIHAAGPRADGPFVAVNMAALSPTTAVSELFGHVRGAFTGAVGAHAGYFGAAHRGTLFLDEIGAAPSDIQSMLLRALESGEVQPVGGRTARVVDVRVIAATDAALEAMADAGTFQLPLLHRLAGYRVDLPPLSRRIDDLGILLRAFLDEERRSAGLPSRSGSPASLDVPAIPWLDAETVAVLAGHAWPGNVRELRNVARQLVARCGDQPGAVLPIGLLPTPTTPEPPTVTPTKQAPSDIDDATLAAVLSAHDWAVRPSARALGISKTTLYDLMERSPAVVLVKQLSDDAVDASVDAADGNVRAAARALRVSAAALKQRLGRRPKPS